MQLKRILKDLKNIGKRYECCKTNYKTYRKKGWDRWKMKREDIAFGMWKDKKIEIDKLRKNRFWIKIEDINKNAKFK